MAPVGVGAPAPEALPEAHVIYALRLIVAYYVDEPDVSKLLTAAWAGALKELAPYTPPAGLQSRPGGDQAAAEASFAAAFHTLLDGAPPGTDRKAVTLAAVKAMAKSLNDNHTYVMLPDAYELYLANEAIGLGYSGLRRADAILAWYVYEDGSGARAGLRAGDTIRLIDGQTAVRERDDDRPDPLRQGVPAALTIDRPGAGELTLSAVPERSQRRILEWRRVGDIGYVRLYRFPPAQTPLPDGRTLIDALDAALAEMRLAGVRGFLLDLRNNPGGSVVVAATVAGRFGLKGVLVENRRRGGTAGNVAHIAAIGESGIGGLPLALLINENSASSSELLASSLQQTGGARVFGYNSAGIVNTARVWPVAGAGLFITTERAYAGPERIYADGRGVAPDEAVSLSAAELAAGRDTQLERALEWLRSRSDAGVGSR